MASSGRRTAIGDLRLSVYARPIHPEFFDIRARRTLRQTDGEAEVWLLDAGHVITLLEGNEALTEVVAPRDLALPKRGLIRTIDLVGESEQRIQTRGPFVYQVAYQVNAERPATYVREAEELLAGARQGHLFSEGSREAAGRPFSYAVPELTTRSLLVHTWHGFPVESTILKTQTLIERGRL